MKKVASQRLTDARLRRKAPRDNALESTRVLYNLLPGHDKSKPLASFTHVPDEHVLEGSVANVRKIALRNCFLKKFVGFTAYKPREEAVSKFRTYEEHCKSSNEYIRSLRHGNFDSPLQPILLIAQRKIARVLRDFSLEDLLICSRWGPGVTSSCKGSKVSSSEKFSSRPDVSREFLSKARLLMPLLPSWSANLADQDYGTIVNPIMPVVKGNRVTFVPKTAKIHRAIAVEPHINVFFQNGLGRMIRHRMKSRAAIDLNDQTLNQRLAHLGSVDDSLATIDLEGASDTLCTELVRDLIPEIWFSWLDAARSHFGELDGEFFRYNKFSSMGNGATFDLESLIFWAISSAVVEREGYNSFWVNVFGDDIVVPSGCYDKVVEALTLSGFIVNVKKSFHKGPFRESCGFDYFLGSNVRPVYLKNIPTSTLDWIIIANQIRILSHRWNENSGCHSSLRQAWTYSVSRIPKEFRYFVPFGFHLKRGYFGGYEGNGLLGNFDESAPSIADNGWEGFIVKGLAAKAVTYQTTSRSRLVASTHSSTQLGNNLPYRDRVVYREVKLFVPGNWYDLGSWS